MTYDYIPDPFPPKQVQPFWNHNETEGEDERLETLAGIGGEEKTIVEKRCPHCGGIL